MGIRRAAGAVFAAATMAVLGTAAPPAQARTPIYLDRSYTFQERAADLVSRMTLAEKASQAVSSKAPAIPRLGIRSYGWWNEALHGVSRLQYEDGKNATTLTNTTSYPIDQSLGSTWDPALVHRVATAISDEAREVVPDNTLDLDFYSPTMNLERDPRWGRNDETYGEDPYLVTRLVSQFVDGMEGKDRHGRPLPGSRGYAKTLTTIKHYAANDSEVNRRTGSSDMDDRTLREYYTKAFRDVVAAAHPGSVMSAYNSINGTPAAADPYLIDTLLRQTFGFDGYVTSDCDAIYEIVAGHHWQPPGYPHPLDNTERHAFAMSAGEDLDCNAGYKDAFNYANQLPTAVAQHIRTLVDRFNENDVDTSLVRLFTARMKLGEFDAPSRVPWVTQARARLARGSWTNSDANGAVTETPSRLALAREAADKSIVLLKNDAGSGGGKVLPLHVPRKGAYKLAVMGYLAHPDPGHLYLGGYSSEQGAAGQRKTVDGLAGIRAAVHAINPQATVDYYPGFTGTSPDTTAASLTDVDPAAVAAASRYDDVVVYTGTDAGTANEDRDRGAMTLPGAQESLIEQVAARNPHTAVYMETIGPMDVSAFAPDVDAILWSSYNGQRKGEGLADVLLGAYDPSGRLPSIWYQHADQIRDILDYGIRPTATAPGRTAWYFTGPLAYAYGHGLSYTRFDERRMRVDRRSAHPGDTVHMSVDVANRGAVSGAETVELYAATPDAPASAGRPRKRLVGFRKVALAPGRTRRVTIPVKVDDLAFYDEARRRWVVDPGRYVLQVARSSADADVVARRSVQVQGSLRAVPHVVTAKPTATGDARRGVQSRVRFPAGVRVHPGLTVAMNDDTLYGKMRRGAPRPLPAGMSVSYRSDRPRVVAVRGRAIRTLHSGVATVTAAVRYRGVRRSVGFVVRVG